MNTSSSSILCCWDNTLLLYILSADGHEWTDAAMVTDYMERGFAGWPRSYGGGDALIYSAGCN